MESFERRYPISEPPSNLVRVLPNAAAAAEAEREAAARHAEQLALHGWSTGTGDTLEREREIHNANVVEDVALAGGCGLKNLQNGATCGREAGHDGPCDFMAPDQVPEALAEKGIEL